MTLCSAPAHAGHWELTPTASGQSTLDGRTYRTFYMSSAPTTNSVSTGYALAASETYGPATGAGPPVTVTATSDLTLTVKAVWTADGNSDDTQPPSGIWFSEDTTATGTFVSNGGATQASTKVDDGFQDPIAQSGSSIGTSAKVHYVKSSGGSVTTTLTASVTSTGTTGAAGGASATASIGPITISIHAQPYNFHKAPGAGKKLATGEIDWVYAYSSTDGNLQDLTSCGWHEHLTYPGGPIGSQPIPNNYYPPNPPFGAPASGYNNPTFSPDVNMAPQLSLTATISDATLVPPFVKPYFHGTFTTTQVFEFDDSATGDINTQIPGPDSGPFSIVRTVNYIGPSNYEYDVTKDSISNSLSLPN